MKRVLYFIGTVTLTFTLYVHGAATQVVKTLAPTNTPLDTIVGVRCNPRGRFALAPQTAIDQPKAAFALVYSEHPSITDEKLFLIAHNISNAAETSDFGSFILKFRHLCENELAKYIPLTLETQSEAELEAIPSGKTSYSLVAHYLVLDSMKLSAVGWHNEDDPVTSGSCKLGHEIPSGQIISHAFVAEESMKLRDHAIESAQHEAEFLQEQSPEKPLHAVVDVALWRAILGGSCETQQSPDPLTPLVVSTEHKKKTRCTLL